MELYFPCNSDTNSQQTVVKLKMILKPIQQPDNNNNNKTVKKVWLKY